MVRARRRIEKQQQLLRASQFRLGAEMENDTNLVVVDDPQLARAYLDEFERVYAQAQSPTRCR